MNQNGNKWHNVYTSNNLIVCLKNSTHQWHILWVGALQGSECPVRAFPFSANLLTFYYVFICSIHICAYCLIKFDRMIEQKQSGTKCVELKTTMYLM